ncbi:hypothetical protein [Candidatus Palauibacter sp.]|uniref:hypothetical protein n=1 Tax=Candidatus Palauibacter sp. TaxID=3101350 RepID=UPI003B52831A
MTPRAVIFGVGVALAATILLAPLAAQDTDFGSIPIREIGPESQESSDRFALFTDCAPVGVMDQGNRQAMTSRLRAARIYDPADNLSMHLLTISADPVGNGGIFFALRFHRPAVTLQGVMGRAVTWSTFATVTDLARVSGMEGELMDEFIDEYLRVNECGQ